MMKNYISDLSRASKFRNISLFDEAQIKGNPVLRDRLELKYGKDEPVLPDIDNAIADYDFANQKDAVIIAIISCKTSLRERIAQACYWKIKLRECPKTEHIKVYLATSDNDGDFELSDKGEKSRDRFIAEQELDGVYILKKDFKTEWENEKVKHYEKLFKDLVEALEKLYKKKQV